MNDLCDIYGGNCGICMIAAPYPYCCRKECGEHEFCKDCNYKGENKWERNTYEFKVGDVCYMPEGHGDKKLIVTKIGPYITNYMQSDGTLYSWLTEEFTKKAIFMYHSNLFEAFLKGDFT